MGESGTMAYNTLAEKYLKRFGSFLEHHSLNLVQVLDEEEESVSVGLASTTEEVPTSRSRLQPPPPLSQSLAAYPLAHHIWDLRVHPISLSWIHPSVDSSGLEELVFVPLPPVGNPDVQKVLLVLVTLTSELKALREQALSDIIPPLLLYGESYEGDLNTNSSLAEGEGHMVLSKFLPFLYDLQTFLHAGYDLSTHWVAQLAALYKDSRPHVVNINGLHLATVFREFGDFLAVLVMLDEVLRNQSILQEHWTKYRQMIKSVQADCSSFESDTEKLHRLERELFLLEKDVLSAQMFPNFLLKLKTLSNSLGKSVSLSEEFQHQLTTLSASIEKDFSEGNDEIKPIAVSALYIFASTMLPSTCDWKKLFNRLLSEPLKKIPAVSIGSSFLWTPDNFLNSFSLKPLDSRQLQLFETGRQVFLKQKVSSLPKELGVLSLQIASWGVKLQEIFYSKSLNQMELNDLSRRCNLLLQGVKHAQVLSQNFRLIMNLHISQNKSVTKQMVCLLCQLLELFKQVESTFFKFSVHISTSALYIVQHVTHLALSHVKLVQKKLSSSGKLDEMRSDSLTVLKVLESALRGPSTPKRLLVAKIALDWAGTSSKLWRDDDAFLILPAALERVSLLVGMAQRVQDVSNGSWIFWHRIVLPTYFSTLLKEEVEATKLPLLALVLQDCTSLLAKNSPHREQALRSLVAETQGYLKYSLVDKMCQDIETDLRLLAHSHLQVQSGEPASPFRMGVKDFKYFMETQLFTFDFQRSFSLRLTVSELIFSQRKLGGGS
jgi:WASH complex subunit 7